MPCEHDGTANEAAIGEVEDGEIVQPERQRQIVAMQKVADAAEDDAIVEVAQRARQDQPQREAEVTVAPALGA